jgi:hypothetical protein
MSNSYNRVCMKLFSTFNNTNVLLCQYYSGMLPLDYQCDLKRLLFLKRVSKHTDKNLLKLFNCFSYGQRLYDKYGIEVNDSPDSIKDKVRSHFDSSMLNLV